MAGFVAAVLDPIAPVDPATVVEAGMALVVKSDEIGPSGKAEQANTADNATAHGRDFTEEIPRGDCTAARYSDLPLFL